METIYKGIEKNLTKTLITRCIKENHIDVDLITKIDINICFPKDSDSLHLWTIIITVNTIKTSYSERYYSKECIRHNYSLTYQQYKKLKREEK